MSRTNVPERRSTASLQPHRRRPPTRLSTLASSNQRLTATPSGPSSARRASVSGLTAAPKTQRSSKTTHKLVVLPSAPQTKPLHGYGDDDADLTLGFETDGGVTEYKSEAERMTKSQRKQAGFKRITAYCVAESFKMKLLASFLKREHNVAPRVFDEALYVMYHLPLLSGYGPNANLRSSAPATMTKGSSYLAALSEAEEEGYQGTYFTQPAERTAAEIMDGYIASSSPVDTRKKAHVPLLDVVSEAEGGLEAGIASDTYAEPMTPQLSEAEAEPWTDSELLTNSVWRTQKAAATTAETHVAPKTFVVSQKPHEDDVVEVVIFEYGVVVFFGLTEGQEKDILEDIENAGAMKRPIKEEDWEIEECHFAHDPHIAYPRIYNDFFTLKSRSHLLKLSIAHALAQSTLLAHYETIARRVLSSPGTLSIPRQLAESGGLKLRRHEALKLTGRLFKLRRDVNLVSNVLDVPELFWSEASLKDLYDAVREYMEIGPRVQVLNEKLGVASDFLDAIHDHLNNNAMERITWIVIWLIVVACLVELGEVIARLIVHSTLANKRALLTSATQNTITLPTSISKEDALKALERLMLSRD